MSSRRALLGSTLGLALAAGAGLVLTPLLLPSQSSAERDARGELSGRQASAQPAARRLAAEPAPRADLAPAAAAAGPRSSATGPPGATLSPSAPEARRLAHGAEPSLEARVSWPELDEGLASALPPGLELELRPVEGSPGESRHAAPSALADLRLKPGRYEVVFRAPGHVPSDPQLVSLQPGQATPLPPPALYPARELRGRVEGVPSGLDPSQVQLEVVASVAPPLDRRGLRACAPDGRFTLPELPPGTYRVRARALVAREAYFSPWTDARAEARESGRESSLRLGLVRVQPVLQGRVVDARGAALGGATVRVEREEATSDAHGDYVLYGLPLGAAWVEAEAPGFLSLRRPVTLGSALDLSLQPVSVVEGQLTDANGAPAASAPVVLCQLHDDGARTSQSAQTDADGRFRFAPVLPGTYALSDAPSGAPLAPSFELRGGETRRALLRLR